MNATAPRASLAHQAYLALEQRIVTGRLAPGLWLTEAEIGQQLGLGRTPVREALQRLALEHMVEIVPRRGVRVTEVNPQHQLLLLEVRRDVERLIAVRAARRASPEQRAAMAAQADRLRAVVQAIGAAGPVSAEAAPGMEATRAANMLMREAAANPYAAQVMAQLYSVSRRFYFFNARRADHLLAGALQEDIIRAVVAGNPEAAAAAVDRLHDTMAIFADRVLTAAGSAAEAPPPAPPSRPEAG